MFKLIKNFIFFILLISIASIAFSKEESFQVIRVIDGDTIAVKIKNKDETVRLIGIQAPEIFTDPVQDFGPAAKLEVEKLLKNKKVILEYNPKFKRDKYKRILADVYEADSNLWINGYLVEKGFAFTYIINKNPIPRITDLIALENKAIANNLPFWQNLSYKVIKAQDTENNIGNYKVVEAAVFDILDTKNAIWLQLSAEQSKGFSLRISKDNLENISSIINLKTIKGKNIRAHGYIDKYSPKYGAFIEIISPFMIEILP
ncbi:MAG: thermonuclease family protein [Alphaproteobacteria bacterium]|nr:thermonuclease family protein [Alphaproteobacteria bacterium]